MLLKTLRGQHADLEKRIKAITDKLEAENRGPTDEEWEEVQKLRKERSDVEDRMAEELEEADRQADGQELRDRLSAHDDENETTADGETRGGGTTKVGAEPLTYAKENTRNSYLADMVRAHPQFGADPGAVARLRRHQEEMSVELPKLERKRLEGGNTIEERNGSVVERFAPEFEKRADPSRTDGQGGEFVPPLWVMSEYVDLQRAGRVAANLCRSIPLPQGTDSINLPTVATGTAVAIQTADGASVNKTDMTTSSVSGGVKTIAGQQVVALQLIEQSPVGFDQVVFEDLAADHAAKLDVQVIDGSNASGQVRGILAIGSIDTTAYTDASPTLPELYPKVADSLNQVATTRYMPATHILMHPRRWYWMASQLDSSNRPFIVPADAGPQNALASVDGVAAEGFVGRILGTPVYVDANVPTAEGGGTEDVIIVGRFGEYYLFEGQVRTRVLPEVDSDTLEVRLQLYSYLAFIPDRRGTANTSIVSGTGLAAPTF